MAITRVEHSNHLAVSVANVEPEVAAFLTQTFFVKHRGGAFEITSIACDCSGVDLTKSPTGPSDSFQIGVRLRPETPSLGHLDGKIRITTTDASYPEIVIPLTGLII